MTASVRIHPVEEKVKYHPICQVLYIHVSKCEVTVVFTPSLCHKLSQFRTIRSPSKCEVLYDDFKTDAHWMQGIMIYQRYYWDLLYKSNKSLIKLWLKTQFSTLYLNAGSQETYSVIIAIVVTFIVSCILFFLYARLRRRRLQRNNLENETGQLDKFLNVNDP